MYNSIYESDVYYCIRVIGGIRMNSGRCIHVCVYMHVSIFNVYTAPIIRTIITRYIHGIHHKGS